MKTSGNTVLITGGGFGLGNALAEAFLSAGNEVVICGREQAVLDEVFGRLPGVHTITCDIADDEGRRRLFERVRDYFPRLNILVNDASMAAATDLLEPGAAEVIVAERSLDLQAPIFLTMKFLPHLLKQPDAAIVNVTASLDSALDALHPAYSAVRAALNSFSQSLRHQLRGTDVHVFEVLPSAVNGKRNRRPFAESNSRDLAEQVLSGMARGSQEIRTGPKGLRYILSKFAPGAAFSILNR